jgi:uncharacterized LabA/DUF88 family protein
MSDSLQSQSQIISRVNVYVDAFNVYHAIAELGDQALKWLNYFVLAKSLLRPNEALGEVNLFTAILNWNQDKQKRHRNWVTAQRAVGVRVHEGRFKQSRKHCVTFDRNCKFYEEKQTDVGISVQMVSDALLGRCDRAILITADSDQIPTAQFISALDRPKLTLYFPPNRAQQARDLGNIIPDRRELTVGQLRTCRLPRTVYDGSGKAVAHMPALYQA